MDFEFEAHLKPVSICLSSLVTELELDSQVWMAQGKLVILLNGTHNVRDFKEFPVGIFLSYLRFSILNKISECGSLRPCGKGRENYNSNAGALFLLCLHWSIHFMVRSQQLVVE